MKKIRLLFSVVVVLSLTACGLVWPLSIDTYTVDYQIKLFVPVANKRELLEEIIAVELPASYRSARAPNWFLSAGYPSIHIGTQNITLAASTVRDAQAMGGTLVQRLQAHGIRVQSAGMLPVRKRASLVKELMTGQVYD